MPDAREVLPGRADREELSNPGGIQSKRFHPSLFAPVGSAYPILVINVRLVVGQYQKVVVVRSCSTSGWNKRRSQWENLPAGV